MSAIGDYLRDTRAELNHVAWPTRLQTIVYTILVVVISFGIAAYLGIFDYIFTGTLTHVIGLVPSQNNSALQVTQTPAAATPSQTTPSQGSATPSFNLDTNSSKKQ